jgi:hypothetical protein
VFIGIVLWLPGEIELVFIEIRVLIGHGAKAAKSGKSGDSST